MIKDSEISNLFFCKKKPVILVTNNEKQIKKVAIKKFLFCQNFYYIMDYFLEQNIFSFIFLLVK